MFIEKIHFPHRDIHPELPEDYMYFSMLLPSKLLGMTPDALAQSLKRPAHELSLQVSEEWDPSIRCLLELQDPAAGAVLQVATTTPDIPFWEPNAHITLLGDSIHLMSPAGGVGAGTALMDATTLTKALINGPVSVETIGSYEAGMRNYAKMAIERSFRGGAKIFGQPDVSKCVVIKME
jgi:2-polyprenyl-6-methoxyphenol hydroxylase-like FAD-dependent oxidoreductase